jgi:galacturan 1,4-alpha-galacturonidase
MRADARTQVFRNFTLSGIRTALASITQCTSFSGATGGCDTSTFQLSNITWENMTGTVASSKLAILQCSGAAPCTNIGIIDDGGVVTTGSGGVGTVSCSNVGILGAQCTSGS